MKVNSTGIVIFSFSLILIFVLMSNFTHKNPKKIVSPTKTQAQISPTVIQAVKTQTSDLFVPYWSKINTTINDQNFQKLIYFGVSVNENGIDQNDQGYKNLSDFIKNVDSNKEKLLGVRLLNQDVNEKILNDKNIQDKVISSVIDVAKNNDFNGILLDFEYSALNFDSVVKKISTFNNDFANKSHSKNVKFYITAYGDTFYRARPFDGKSIQKNMDGVYVLAYDFHKAKGNPGPNFPFNKLEDEDYDFQTMISDFSSNVSPEKIIVTFGMFGYDWTVGEKGTSLKLAEPVSLNDAKQKFFNSCKFKDCKIKTNLSGESEITYIDENGQKHDVWIETEESINIKKKFLISKGLNQTAIWAYSYF